MVSSNKNALHASLSSALLNLFEETMACRLQPPFHWKFNFRQPEVAKLRFSSGTLVARRQSQIHRVEVDQRRSQKQRIGYRPGRPWYT
eukprot:1351621-Amorphochlora_amoeboformis.AAC.1